MNVTKLIVCAMAIALTVSTGCSNASQNQNITKLADETDMEGSPNLDYGSVPEDRTIQTMSLTEPTVTPESKAAILKKYSKIDTKKVVDRNLLAKALLYWEANASNFPNKNFISVVNFSIKSNKDRFYLINMKDGSVVLHHVAHGSKSDQDGNGIPEHFSNVNNSNMSSLGVYRASEVYPSTKFKYAMRLDGLSKTNSNARMRAVVLHSAWYVWESDLISPGNTYGCLGLSESVAQGVIANVKNGSMIYAGLSTDK